MRRRELGDRFGLGWRPALAAGILAHLDRIDVVELIADDYLEADAATLRPLAALAAKVPVLLHGVSMGLAGAEPVEQRRLRAMGRLMRRIGAERWSEHLAFTRAAGIEIGHLAAPPRNPASIEAAIANIGRAAGTTGTLPDVENIATLALPPGSTMDEAEWLGAVIRGSGAGLLLDLHNLYANAVNGGADPFATLRRLPLDRVAQVHLGGGDWIEGPGGAKRLLDDHLHDVPAPVFALLGELGRLTRHSLTVVIERDGAYPPMAQMLDELDRARGALALGRRQAA